MDKPTPVIKQGLIPERHRKRLYTVIYEADTRAGKIFDVILLFVILVSVVAVMLESVASIKNIYGSYLDIIEWVVTILFTLEYIGRLVSVQEPLKYVFSFYGIIDLLAMLPKYISLLFPGLGFLIAIRAVRLLRVFRILKLSHFTGAGDQLIAALRKSQAKIAVFLFSVLVLCIIMGTLMYMIEGPASGFTSIPVSVYWTIVTLTTVGFGDITPATPLGQFISVIIMIMGYGIIAVPTGLVTAQFMTGQTQAQDSNNNTRICPDCSESKHRDDAQYCFKCGSALKK